MQPATRLQLCGRLVVTIEGRRYEHALPARQGRLLFVYLAANRRRPVSRAEVIDAIWPERTPAAPDAALNALLSKLRRVLGRERIPPRGEPTLVLPAGSFVDLEAAGEAIHRAESAVRTRAWPQAWAPARVALHTALRGFLPAEQAPWIDEQRRRLEEIVLRAYECIAVSSLALGGSELDAAKRAATALIERTPYRESGYRYLIEALRQEGNGAEALLVYERLRTLLRTQLGAAPSPATQELHRRLLQPR